MTLSGLRRRFELDSEPANIVEVYLAWMIVAFCLVTIILNIIIASKDWDSISSKILIAQSIPMIYAVYIMFIAATNETHLMPIYVRSALLLIMTTQLMEAIIKFRDKK
jgi:hypothetical protein